MVWKYGKALLVLNGPVESLEEAIAQAIEAVGTDPQELANYLTTTSFSEVADPRERYNCFRRAHVYLGIDVVGALRRTAMKIEEKAHTSSRRDYYRGLARGLGIAAKVAESPLSYVTEGTYVDLRKVSHGREG